MSDQTPSRVPALSRGVRMREDKARGGWVLLAPERVFKLDDIGRAVLDYTDGVRSEAEIIDLLAARYSADRAQIASDVAQFFDGLSQRRVLEFH